jgi:hypothetical protein
MTQNSVEFVKFLVKVPFDNSRWYQLAGESANSSMCGDSVILAWYQHARTLAMMNIQHQPSVEMTRSPTRASEKAHIYCESLTGYPIAEMG